MQRVRDVAHLYIKTTDELFISSTDDLMFVHSTGGDVGQHFGHVIDVSVIAACFT